MSLYYPYTQSVSKDIHNSTKIYKANGVTPSATSKQAMMISAVRNPYASQNKYPSVP